MVSYHANTHLVNPMYLLRCLWVSLWVRALEHDGWMLLTAEEERERREERRTRRESETDIFYSTQLNWTRDS